MRLNRGANGDFRCFSLEISRLFESFSIMSQTVLRFAKNQSAINNLNINS